MAFPKLSLKLIFGYITASGVLILLLTVIQNENSWQHKSNKLVEYQQKIKELKVFLGNKEEDFKVEGIQKLSHKKNEFGKSENEIPEKFWFFLNGSKYPEPAKVDNKSQRIAKLLPEEDGEDDRIVNQLMFVPPNYDEIKKSGKMKKILLYNGIHAWGVDLGQSTFLSSKCPVDTCILTVDRTEANSSDLILFKDIFISPKVAKHPRQLYMIYILESPYHMGGFSQADVFNWTATYRRDSDIVAPYEKFVYFDPKIRQIEQNRNYAANKTKKVAWFVSNCGAQNDRLEFALELQNYIQVDIYGACGNLSCPRTDPDCFGMLDRDYKFYLSFENSNCKDYITEKFFVNGLTRNVVPIVLGARPIDYKRSAPENSYIDRYDFESVKALADYLHKVDKDDNLYNSYFKYKGTGENINTFFWCRVCSMLHDEKSIDQPKWYRNINDWWNGPEICSSNPWNTK